MVILNIKNFGQIKLKMNYDAAKNTAANFVELARNGFYNGLTFHRIIKGFMIQGGDPVGNGTGGPDYCIKGEFKSNGENNPLSHKRGVISMARAQDPDSAGSQFFIMHKDGEFLDGNYAAFGEVVEGIEVVDAIAKVRTHKGYDDSPYEKVIIESVTVEDEPEIKVEKIR